MSQQYLFNEPGSIPGLAGSFAHCRVEVDDSGNIDVQPLTEHPAYVSGPETEAQAEQPQAEQPVEALPEQVTPPVQITVPQGG